MSILTHPETTTGLLVSSVVLGAGLNADDELEASRIRFALRIQRSPRHVPDRIIQVEEVPRTLTGKKLNVPLKRILLGAEIEDVIRERVLPNPGSPDDCASLRVDVGTVHETRLAAKVLGRQPQICSRWKVPR